METVKDRLDQAKKRRERSIRSLQAELHEAGVPGSSYANVHAYFKGRTQPSVEFLSATAAALNVRPEWLAFGRGEMTEQEELAKRTATAGAAAGSSSSTDESDVTATPGQIEGAFLEGLPALRQASSASWHAVAELYEAICTAPGRLSRLGAGMSKALKAKGEPGARRAAFQAVHVESAREAASLVGAAAREAGIDLDTLNRWFLDRYIQTTAQALAMLFVAPHRLQPGPQAWRRERAHASGNRPLRFPA